MVSLSVFLCHSMRLYPVLAAVCPVFQLLFASAELFGAASDLLFLTDCVLLINVFSLLALFFWHLSVSAVQK